MISFISPIRMLEAQPPPGWVTSQLHWFWTWWTTSVRGPAEPSMIAAQRSSASGGRNPVLPGMVPPAIPPGMVAYLRHE